MNMKSQRPDRQLFARYFQGFLQAIKDENGAYSLRLMLMNADLGNHVSEHLTEGQEVHSSELATLLHSIREYYGTGARGLLNRIGRGVWKWLLTEASFDQKIKLSMIRILPLVSRRMKSMEFLADQMKLANGQVSVHLLDTDLIFVDQTSDATYGQSAIEPICWATTGMIQAALLWASGEEYNVDEISCRAMGDEACKFRIQLE